MPGNRRSGFFGLFARDSSAQQENKAEHPEPLKPEPIVEAEQAFGLISTDKLESKLDAFIKNIRELKSSLITITHYQDVLEEDKLLAVYRKLDDLQDALIKVDTMQLLLQPIKEMNKRWNDEFQGEDFKP